MPINADIAKLNPKELVHKIRVLIDQLDDLVDVAQAVLPAPVKVLVPLVDAIRKVVDVVDNLLK